MKTIITYGTFDLFHVGHLNLLRRLRDLGDRLIVGVSTDEFNSCKGKRSIIGFSDRAAVVSAVRYVDIVIPECSWDQKLEDIKKYSVDVLGMGDDWKGRFDSYRDQCEVVYLERTWGISSSSVRNGIGGEHASELLLLRQAADTILRITRSLGV